MMLFRPACAHDLQEIHALAMGSGIGITTLPKDLTLLKKRLTQSHASFNPSITSPCNEYYLFVLADPATGHVAGTAAIEATTEINASFYSYKRHTCIKTCSSLDIQSKQDYLSLVHDTQGRTEMCTLYLEPAYRRHGNGLLLSLARFFFMAQYPERFVPTVIAEMRGISDDQGHSPFWDAVGCPFFHMSFTQADQLTNANNKQFIADLMPEHPIYLNLLPQAAQEVIGHTHASTVPAMTILLREGFKPNQTVDIFDAGPTLEVSRDKIRTLARSQLMPLSITTEELDNHHVLLANTQLNFRATISSATLNTDEQTCHLSPLTADLLNLSDGDFVRISII